MIIDFHTHAFPDRIVTKTIEVLSKNSGNVAPHYGGSIKELEEYMFQNDIDYSVVLNIATNENQQSKVNEFAKEIICKHEKIIAFGSVCPFAENAIEELIRIKEMGLKGIKLHPNYQKFFVDDSKLFGVYRKAAELGLITVFHAGVDIGLFETDYAAPKRIAAALEAFDGGTVVCAHFGGYMQWDDVEKYLVNTPVYFDTAYCYSRMPYLHAKRIKEKHGVDKILFGSDMPWSSTTNEMRFIDAIANNEQEKEMMLYGNAAKILGL